MEYTGRGDPKRSIELMWGVADRPKRGPKPGLSVPKIVRAAIELTDADGIDALSMRRIADRLGVGAMSLYTYVPGKAELLDVMLDTVYGEISLPEPADGDWRSRLERIARENRAVYLRHPWLLQVARNRSVLGPNVATKYESELRAVDGIGLDDVEMDAVLELVLGYVQGAARGAVETTQAAEVTGMTDDQWWAAHEPYLDKIIDASRFPLAGRVGVAVGAYDPERHFEFGLQRVLDGIDQLVTSRAASGDNAKER